jgi:hypothetical protein
MFLGIKKSDKQFKKREKWLKRSSKIGLYEILGNTEEKIGPNNLQKQGSPVLDEISELLLQLLYDLTLLH